MAQSRNTWETNMSIHSKEQRKRIVTLEWALYEVCELARVRTFGVNFGEIAYEALTPGRYNSIKETKRKRQVQSDKDKARKMKKMYGG